MHNHHWHLSGPPAEVRHEEIERPVYRMGIADPSPDTPEVCHAQCTRTLRGVAGGVLSTGATPPPPVGSVALTWFENGLSTLRAGLYALTAK
jgi:hypothetical protein